MTTIQQTSSQIIRRNNSILRSACSAKSNRHFLFSQTRHIVHAHYAPIAPRPPPREYEPAFNGQGGTSVTLGFFIYSMKEKQAQNSVHVRKLSQYSDQLYFGRAYREQFRWWAQWIPITIYMVTVGIMIFSWNTAGICPVVYTQEWQEASRERDRAENSYPFTRYLDRRRKERGPHWLLTDYHPNSPNFQWQSGQRDTAFLRAKAIKARKLWLEQEERRKKLAEEDEELEKRLDESEGTSIDDTKSDEADEEELEE